MAGEGGEDAQAENVHWVAFAAWWFEPLRQGRLLRIARGFLRDRQLAEDAVQVSGANFMKSYGHTFESLTDGKVITTLERPDALASTVVKNRCRQTLRWLSRHPGPPSDSADLDGADERAEGNEVVRPEVRRVFDELRRARPHLYAVVWLVHIGYSIVETAALLGLSRGQADRRLREGYRWMRRRLDDEGFER